MMVGFPGRIASVFRRTRCAPAPLGERRRRGHWQIVVIALLLVGGWILPSVAPPDGVTWGATGLRNRKFYWRNIYYGNCGFFSKCVVVEDTWEGTHGHTWIIGPWIEGCLISLAVPVFGLFLLLAPLPGGCLLLRLYIAALGGAARVCFWLMWTWPFAWEGVWPWMNWVLFSTLLLFSAFMLWSCERNKFRLPMERAQVWAADSLLIYPIWVLVLELIQGLWPSIGWFMTMAGCSMLTWRARHAEIGVWKRR